MGSSVAVARPGSTRPVVNNPGHSSKQRFLTLDGVRGLAIIAVLCTHASYVFENRLAHRVFEVGWTGVDLFFVLSGFLITGILIDTKVAVNRAESFYARRVLRIFPVYYLAILIVLGLQTRWPWMASVSGMDSWKDRLSVLFYFKDLAPLWQHNAHETLFSHFWSLAVEEQFYFIWPMIVWHLRPKRIIQVCGVALAAALALRVGLVVHSGFQAWMLFFPLTRADGLFAGSALAAMFAIGYRPGKRLLLGSLSACVLVLLAIAAKDFHEFLYGGPLVMTIGISCLAIAFAVLIAYSLDESQTVLVRVLRTPWLRSFGKYSYGIYVFHVPIYHFAEHVATVYLKLALPLHGLASFAYLGILFAASYGVAWVSFHFFEQYFLNLKHYFEPAYSRESAITAVQVPATVATS